MAKNNASWGISWIGSKLEAYDKIKKKQFTNLDPE